MKIHTVILLLIIILSGCHSREYYPIDGDSFIMGSTEYRLACIDAPEMPSSKGIEARDYLSSWIPKITRIEEVRQGYYDRTIVYLWAADTLINERMYATGHARFASQYKCKYKHLIKP